MKPKVSVILPVYNAADTLPACIESLLAQQLADIEIICINDQTPDTSQHIIDDYVEKDARLVSLINKKNIGLGASRNIGVKYSSGDYIFHIDPDDTAPVNALKILYQTAIAHDSELVRGGYWRSQVHSGQKEKYTITKRLVDEGQIVINTNLHEFPDLFKSPEGHWAFLYRRDIAVKIKYPEDLKMGQDAFFLTCILAESKKITIIPDVIYHYLANPKSTMNNFTTRKYLDVLNWRKRAFHHLMMKNHPERARHVLLAYLSVPWHQSFFSFYKDTPDRKTLSQLSDSLLEVGDVLKHLIADTPGENPSKDFISSLLEQDFGKAENIIFSTTISFDEN